MHTGEPTGQLHTGGGGLDSITLGEHYIGGGGLGRAVWETVIGLEPGFAFEDREAEAGARNRAGTGLGPHGAHL